MSTQSEHHEMKLFRLPNGLKVWNTPQSRSDTQFLYRESFERRCYEKHGVTVSDGDVIFDVGANVGMFALSLMRYHRDLRIVCFEPVPGTYKCLMRNLAENRQETSEVMALNIGLGTAEGNVTIEYFPGAPSNSTLYSVEKHRDFARILDGVHLVDLWRMNKLRALLMAPLFPFRRRLLGPAFDKVMQQGVSIACRIRPLSSLVRDLGISRIDLLKIDVEGAEMDVLDGIDSAHWPLIRQIAMEVDPANKHRIPELRARLDQIGFDKLTVESMFGGECLPDDPVACTLFAVRSAAMRASSTA